MSQPSLELTLEQTCRQSPASQLEFAANQLRDGETLHVEAHGGDIAYMVEHFAPTIRLRVVAKREEKDKTAFQLQRI